MLYGFAFALQLCIFVAYAYKASHFHQTPLDIVHRLVDMLLRAAPPGLPSVFLLLGAVARQRLDKDGIVLLYPKALRLAASVDLVAFDKTGTLTDSVVRPRTSDTWLFVCLYTCKVNPEQGRQYAAVGQTVCVGTCASKPCSASCKNSEEATP